MEEEFDGSLIIEYIIKIVFLKGSKICFFGMVEISRNFDV